VLPFFSSGGTNLVINLTVSGFLLGIMFRANSNNDASESSYHSDTRRNNLIGYEL
jgi:cell division protein FtsW (lipid II flippase)